MHIREALASDNDQLQAVMARCPQGTSLIITLVNTPDFFARAKAYPSSKVYVACDGGDIIGSAAYAIRQALVNGTPCAVGYEFQYFTAPDHRRKGIARQLHQQIEEDFIRQGVALSYLLITEGNLASMRLFEGLGFHLHRTLTIANLMVYKQAAIPEGPKIRRAASRDLEAIAALVSKTWSGDDLYEPTSPEALAQFISRTPAYELDNLFIAEAHEEITACAGFWDWSRIMQITIQGLGPRLRAINWALDLLRHFRPMPLSLNPGATMKQWAITPIAFQDPEHLAMLVRYINNQAQLRGIEQIICVFDRDHDVLQNAKGLFRIDVSIHVFVKSLQQNVALGDRPVCINVIDL